MDKIVLLNVGIHSHPKKNWVWVLSMGLIPITKTYTQNSDLVGFIPRPIPMKPRFGGFHGYEKWGFQNTDQVFSGVNVYSYL